MLSYDLQCYVNYDYDKEYPCQTFYGYAEDEGEDENYHSSCYDICRCGTIVNAQVISVDTWSLAKRFSPDSNDLILTYCIDRILVAQHTYCEDNWDVIIDGGYYGDEIGGVKLIPDLQNILASTFQNLLAQESDSDKIKFVLIEEYGYLLDSIKDLIFSIELVEKDKIIVPNKEYKNTAGKGIYDSLTYEGPRGVLRETENGGLILIDGYHRFSAFENDEAEMKMVVGRIGKKSGFAPQV